VSCKHIPQSPRHGVETITVLHTYLPASVATDANVFKSTAFQLVKVADDYAYHESSSHDDDNNNVMIIRYVLLLRW
jgi:hypothetical protein